MPITDTSCPSSLLLSQEAPRNGKSIKILLLVSRGEGVRSGFLTPGLVTQHQGRAPWYLCTALVGCTLQPPKESCRIPQVSGCVVKGRFSPRHRLMFRGTKAAWRKVVWHILGYEVEGKYVKRKQNVHRIHPRLSQLDHENFLLKTTEAWPCLLVCFISNSLKWLCN